MCEIAELIAVALTGDEEPAWNAIRKLQERGDAEVFEAAANQLRSASSKERGRGVDILAQLGTPKPSDELRRRCADLILEMLKGEQSASVLESIGVALGQLQDPRAVEALLPLHRHPEADVRYGVVFGLLPHSDPTSVSALIELSADSDEDVRNWATFGLGTMENVDTPLLREALVRRLDDTNAEIRGEALVGLARRKDRRVVEPLRKELAAEDVSILAVEAAEAFGDPSMVPLLSALRDSSGNATDNYRGELVSELSTLQSAAAGRSSS